jgi:hypothetical protein
MILLDGDSTVLISCEEEVAASYRGHRPTAGQFAVARPYQAAPAPDSRPGSPSETGREESLKPPPSVLATPASDAAGHSAVPSDDEVNGAEEPHDTSTAAAQQLETATYDVQLAKRRKRKRKQRTYQPNAQVAATPPSYCCMFLGL